MKTIQVVAAAIYNNAGEVLCTQRKNQGELANKWEFPGGKIKMGESHVDALKREIWEELSLNIEIGGHVYFTRHSYETFRLFLHVYEAKVLDGNISLNAHQSFKWMPKKDLLKLDWAQADYPILEKLQKESKCC